MTEAHGYLKQVLANLKVLREQAGMTEATIEEQLILGPGWVRRFEQGETVPSIDMLLAVLHQTGATLEMLLKGLPGHPDAAEIERVIFAEQEGADIVIHFRYADFDAEYLLRTATIEQFEVVVKILRDGLARLTSTDEANSKAIKTEAVASCFLKAVETWPHANPSDLWWFVVSRAYCDPYNHPAHYARLDFTQSWKRTGGWALEEILVRHYAPFLKTHDINLFIATGAAKRSIIKGLKVGDRLEADKIDVVLTGDHKAQQKFFGVVHVKASFAERRTDDVPMSAALVKHGFTSPLWTMDCKSTPSAAPNNRGELGDAEGDRRSAKRKDIEDEEYFSGCFSYNKNTAASGKKVPPTQRIHVCDFTNPDDAFSQFIIQRWRAFRTA
jgi:transcriptional regulator with XRE-family HTH domain